MKAYVAFLRGINVNGIKIKMAELRAVFEDLGYRDVKTTLATGNVSFVTGETWADEDHKSRIELALHEAFNYEAFVVLMTKETLDGLVSESESMSVPKDFNHYILLSNEPSISSLLNDLFTSCSSAEGEQLVVTDRAVYWIVQKGETLKTDFGKKVLGSKAYKAIVTSRTVGTLKKIAGV